MRQGWRAAAASSFAATVGLVLFAEACAGAPLVVALGIGGFACGLAVRLLENGITERPTSWRGALAGGALGAVVTVVVGVGVDLGS